MYNYTYTMYMYIYSTYMYMYIVCILAHLLGQLTVQVCVQCRCLHKPALVLHYVTFIYMYIHVSDFYGKCPQC